MALKFTEVSAARYDEMLGVLPPIAWLDKGFLVGEAWRHNDEGQPMFAPFVTQAGRFYEGSEPITVADWRKLDPRPLLPSRTVAIGFETDAERPMGDACAFS